MSKLATNTQTTNRINTETLPNLLQKISALPDAGSGGIELPELSNPASVEQIVDGYEAIDAEGNKITGTNPYEKTATDNTVSTQASGLVDIESQLAQALTLLDGKAAGGGGSGYKVAIEEVKPDSLYWGADLDFTPNFVAILGNSEGTYTTNYTGGSNTFEFLAVEGTFNGQNYSFSSYLTPKSSNQVYYGINSEPMIFIDEKRFDFFPISSERVLPSYLYIAIGE